MPAGLIPAPIGRAEPGNIWKILYRSTSRPLVLIPHLPIFSSFILHHSGAIHNNRPLGSWLGKSFSPYDPFIYNEGEMIDVQPIE